MLADYNIRKPPTVTGYSLHQLVQGLTNGISPLFVDRGDKVIIRSDQEITKDGRPIPRISLDEIIGFELRACVSKKIKGRHIYYPLSDRQHRYDWLHTQGAKLGFEPLTVSCRTSYMSVDDGGTRQFRVDRTDFVGVLRVLDVDCFRGAIAKGVGSTAKAFGFGMLII